MAQDQARENLRAELERRRETWRGPIPRPGEPEFERYLAWANREPPADTETAPQAAPSV